MAKTKDLPGIITRIEAAAYLRVSLPVFDSLIRAKVDPIPCMRCGKRFLFQRKALIEWATRQADRQGLNASGRQPPARRARPGPKAKARTPRPLKR